MSEYNPLLPMPSYDLFIKGDGAAVWDNIGNKWVHGDWVKYEDALAEITALRARVEELERMRKTAERIFTPEDATDPEDEIGGRRHYSAVLNSRLRNLRDALSSCLPAPDRKEPPDA